MGRWLAQPGIPFEAVRLAWSLTPRLGTMRAVPGSVCVLDACYPRIATESLVAEILEASPLTHVIVVAEELTEEAAFPLLRAGVRGLLTYTNVHRQLVPSLAAVARGGYWVPRVLLTKFLDLLLARGAPPLPRRASLSRREHEVLEAVLHNLSNKEIASRLSISERTVKFHVSNLLAKFHVRRRADLILHSVQSPPGEPAAVARKP